MDRNGRTGKREVIYAYQLIHFTYVAATLVPTLIHKKSGTWNIKC